MKARSFRRRAWTWAAVAGLALALNAGSPAGADSTDPALAKTLDRILSDPRLSGSQVGVVVSDANTGQALYQHDGGDRLVPASSTKLLTSTAAMQLLGPDYRFSTDVLSDGSRHGSVLVGDLYLRGTGDPTMLAADYDRLAAQVAAAGIRRVTGKLIADDTRFDSNRLGSSWAADDESAYYSSQISPLTVAPDTDYDAGTVLVKVTPVPLLAMLPASDSPPPTTTSTSRTAPPPSPPARATPSPSTATTAPTPSWSAATYRSAAPSTVRGSACGNPPGTRPTSSRMRWPITV